MHTPVTASRAGETDSDNAAERTLEVLGAFYRLGPGGHSLAEVMERTGLPRSTCHRMLQACVKKGFLARPAFGVYALADAAPAPGPRLPVLPLTTPAISDELSHLQRRTSQVAAIHSPVLLAPSTRVCVAVAHGTRSDFLQALDAADAADALRVAPLRQDAAGLVMLANLDDNGSRTRTTADRTLWRIQIDGFARSAAPIPGWSMLSVPLRRGQLLVGSLSLLCHAEELDRRLRHFVDVAKKTAAEMERLESRAVHHPQQPLARAC